MTQGTKHIGNQVRAAMLIERSEHFKALAVIKQPLILKEKKQRALLDCHPDLPLTETTCLGILGVSNQSIVRALSGELRTTKLVLDDDMKVEVGLSICDGRKLEGIGMTNKGDWYWSRHQRWSRKRITPHGRRRRNIHRHPNRMIPGRARAGGRKGC
jgi:hypothetical protein